MAVVQRRINVYAAPWLTVDVNAMLYKYHVLAGNCSVRLGIL